MEPIIRESTSHLPQIEFKPDGNLLLEGRAIPEDVFRLFDPLIEFVSELNDVDVNFKVNLEYFNTTVSKKLMELLKNMDANNKIGKILVNWHFEEGDEGSLELAEVYEENLLRTEFRYHEYAESADII